MKRSSGILLPISALPSNYGIGTLGRAAYRFADFLKSAGQSYWQVLPLGPTSYGDSPYQSFSSNAGNPYFIDLDMLIEEGLLKKKEVRGCDWGRDLRYIDYGKIYDSRFRVLRIAKKRGWDRDAGAVSAFRRENPWVEDYALFMSIKKRFGQISWQEWPDEDIRLHKKGAVARYTSELGADIEFFIYIQYLFFKQWTALREYVNGLGIGIIGDVPIYAALDSADVWAEAGFFELDEDNYPVEVAGVPPDYFSEDGQLWGNPLYDWAAMKEDGFGWWQRRIAGAAKMFDVIRIDHFRGFDEYWAVPAGDENARGGKWRKGPGMELVGLLSEKFPDTEFIAEDLGDITPTVRELLAECGWPGMKVLEFAFDSKEESTYLPHNFIPNCVCYTGTHDNATVAEWAREAKKEDLRFARRYMGMKKRETMNDGMIRAGMASVAGLFVAQIQDYLGLGKGHRINIPGTPAGNWRWRMLPGEADERLAGKIRKLTALYGRIPIDKKKENI